MDWKARLEASRASPNLVKPQDLDFTARKIINGLGWPANRVKSLCAALSCPCDDDEPLIDVARRVLDFSSGGQFGALSPNRRFVLDVRNSPSGRRCWSTDGDLYTMCEVSKSVPGAMIVTVRVKSSEGRDEGLSFVFLREGDVPQWLLRPVSTYMLRENGCMVWRRETSALIRDMASCLGWNVPKPDER